MSVFQILNQYVTVIDGDKTYEDTLDHFKSDANVAAAPQSVIYDSAQECCVVDGKWLAYLSETYDGYIAKLSDLIAAKEKREYVAPAEPTAEEQKASLKADYDSAVQELSNSMSVALLTGDTDAQASIRADFADLQQAYKEAVENV